MWASATHDPRAARACERTLALNRAGLERLWIFAVAVQAMQYSGCTLRPYPAYTKESCPVAVGGLSALYRTKRIRLYSAPYGTAQHSLAIHTYGLCPASQAHAFNAVA